MKVEFTDFIRPDSGCKLAEKYPIIKGVYDATHGNPCDGCAYARDCSFLKKVEQKRKEENLRKFGQVSFKTNKEIAEEKGISKRQASKIKRRERKINL